ncbi:MAG: TonB-dependent receptor [Rhodanobacter sp.]
MGYPKVLAVAIASALSLSMVALPARAAHDETAVDPALEIRQLPTVEVIGIAPLPEIGVPLNQIPNQVQRAQGKDLRRQHSLDLADYLNSNFQGITINATQDNPFQPDVLYHGFRASPLLGAPEGLSVYQDGVRINESVGDTVNWDLIPESAIASTTLISGASVPLFGLNTLGGALSVQTKDGRNNPGTELSAYGGSFERRDAQFETGGTQGNFDYFLTANYLHEDGWRDLSPSTLRQAFAKVGWQDDDTSLHLAYTFADNNLIGNGVQPQSMLNNRYQSIFTAPDQTLHKYNFLNLTGSHSFSDTLMLSGNLYYRRLTTAALNGDDNDDYAGPTSDCAGLAAAAPDFDDDDLAACAPGINHASHLTERSVGGGLQLSASQDLFGLQNRAVLGVSAAHTLNSFFQTQQLAGLTPGRATVTNAFPYNDPDINPLQMVNDLAGYSDISGIYFGDTLSPSDLVHLTVSGRYDYTKVVLNGVTVPDDSPAVPIEVNHSFHRLDPAIGITITPNHALTLYANYNEGSRAPTSIELGCADPDIPCSLPNDFASDPDLKQVVARTFEIGARGAISGTALNWNVDVFRTRDANEIQLIATSLSEGYFDNVGGTRRQGVDVGFGGRNGHLDWRVSYSYLQATFQSTFTLASPSNSSCINPLSPDDPDFEEDGCLITVRPGDHMPLTPRNTLRVALDYALTGSWNVGANIIAASGMYLMGNENNADRAGAVTNAEQGDEVAGSGRIGGYAVVNLHTDYQVTPKVDVFLRLTNLFDRKYGTSGFLTESGFNPDGSFRQDPDDDTHENFVAPAPPRAAWLGVRVRL